MAELTCPVRSKTFTDKILVREDDEAVITILGTNDMHGSFETQGPAANRLGGFQWFSGYVGALKQHLAKNYGDQGTLLILDGGDAAQGSLFSNYSEGMLAASLMKKVGYTAAVLGNHAFDFGPRGWKKDKCDPKEGSCDPLETVNAFVKAAGFPFVADNVKAKATGGTPEFVQPYSLVDFLGRKIAIVGLESPSTDRTTVPENVAGLAFSDGIAELQNTVEELWRMGKADVFILICHEGDRNGEENMKRLLASLPRRSTGEPLVDAAIASHTHELNDSSSNGIPYIQSGAEGKNFGLMQLVVKKNAATGRLEVRREKNRQKAGIPIEAAPGCFMGYAVAEDATIADILKRARAEIAPIAGLPLGSASAPITREGSRISDSELGNLIADMMREASGAEIAFINSGDIRDDLPAGTVTFEDLFNVLPKNLRLMQVKKLPVDLLARSLTRSIRSCGVRGALQISGANVVFERDCRAPVDGQDPNARLLKIIRVNGEELWRAGETGSADKYVHIATTDFVLAGGAGYRDFQGIAPDGPGTDLKDEIVKRLRELNKLKQDRFKAGRYINCLDPGSNKDPGCVGK